MTEIPRAVREAPLLTSDEWDVAPLRLHELFVIQVAVCAAAAWWTRQDLRGVGRDETIAAVAACVAAGLASLTVRETLGMGLPRFHWTGRLGLWLVGLAAVIQLGSAGARPWDFCLRFVAVAVPPTFGLLNVFRVMMFVDGRLVRPWWAWVPLAAAAIESASLIFVW